MASKHNAAIVRMHRIMRLLLSTRLAGAQSALSLQALSRTCQSIPGWGVRQRSANRARQRHDWGAEASNCDRALSGADGQRAREGSGSVRPSLSPLPPKGNAE